MFTHTRSHSDSRKVQPLLIVVVFFFKQVCATLVTFCHLAHAQRPRWHHPPPHPPDPLLTAKPPGKMWRTLFKIVLSVSKSDLAYSSTCCNYLADVIVAHVHNFADEPMRLILKSVTICERDEAKISGRKPEWFSCCCATAIGRSGDDFHWAPVLTNIEVHTRREARAMQWPSRCPLRAVDDGLLSLCHGRFGSHSKANLENPTIFFKIKPFRIKYR